jgi:hypothetical protein
MHPVEHLYYYSCILPSLLFTLSPFAFLWNGVHLLLAPAASHSGFEDHFQADAFHYMHHRYFECNYAGYGAGFLDKMMGTFVESMEHKDKDGVSLRDDPKSTLRVRPSKEFLLYLFSTLMCMIPWASSALQVGHGVRMDAKYIHLVSFLVSFGPVCNAFLVTKIFGAIGGTVIRRNFANYLHLAIGALFCSIPIHYACYLSLQS